MFERFRRTEGAPADTTTTGNGRTAVADAPPATGREPGTTRRGEEFGWEDGPERTGTTRAADAPTSATAPTITRERMRDVRARQRDEYGGINWGAAFFGWLVAVGPGVILLGLIARAGAAGGVPPPDGHHTGTGGVGGGLAPPLVLVIAHYARGHLAGPLLRLPRA